MTYMILKWILIGGGPVLVLLHLGARYFGPKYCERCGAPEGTTQVLNCKVTKCPFRQG